MLRVGSLHLNLRPLLAPAFAFLRRVKVATIVSVFWERKLALASFSLLSGTDGSWREDAGETKALPKRSQPFTEKKLTPSYGTMNRVLSKPSGSMIIPLC